MSDLPERLRRHYAEQSLSNEATRRILARGSLERRTRHRWRFILAVAAMLIAVVSVYSARHYAVKIEVADVENAVETFFAASEPQLDRQSSDSAALREWLVQHGAPAASKIPESLGKFPSVGCAKLKIGRQTAFMLCFKVEVDGTTAVAGGKRTELVHVVFVNPRSLRNPAPPRNAAKVLRHGNWSFTAWSDRSVAYVVVSALTPEQLQSALGAENT
ncbi:MAG TPA: hypothetical protein VFT72_04450 [Opitutaceae bacterium]|nr:hypothetical protein [Opitutaceae bacterium]